MAIGAITDIIPGESYAVELLASAIAANGAPTGNAGLEINALRKLGAIPSILRVGVKSTAGSGTMTVTLRVWLKFGSIGWMVAKSLNAGSAIAETGNDTLDYSEEVQTAYGADRIYLEIVAIAGTSTAVTGYALVGR
jgi:hypothetical protein